MQLRSAFAAAAMAAVTSLGAGLVAPSPAAADDPELLALVGLASPVTGLQVDVLHGAGLEVGSLTNVPVAVVKGTASELAAAAQLPWVLSVAEDRPLQLADDDTNVQIRADSVWTDLGLDGSGITVAVVDSGIDGTHPDLPYGDVVVENVKILGEEHYAPGISVPIEGLASTDTTSGHGTHVAGIIAGRGTASGGRFRGVAPGASLIGLGAGESTGMVTAAVALDWVVGHAQQYGIRVVNNSWADGAIAYDPNHPLNRATKAVHDAGIVVVQAAGNDGTWGPGGISRYCIPDWVVCVGAATKASTLASLSSLGFPGDTTASPDLIAPGEYVASARSLTAAGATANFSPFDLSDPASPEVLPTELWPYYTVKSGTSMATPHVSGVVALVLQANPRLTPDAVREVLKRTAHPVAGCPEYACGAGVVDARAAVDLARSVHNIKKLTRDGVTFWAAEQVTTRNGTVGASLFGTAKDTWTFTVPAGADSATVAITWSSAVSDLDLTVKRPDGSVAGSSAISISQVGTTSHSETVTLTAPGPGTWTVEASGFLSAGQAYLGTATVLSPL